MSEDLSKLIRAALAVGFRLSIDGWDMLIDGLQANPSFRSSLDDKTIEGLEQWESENHEELKFFARLSLGLAKLGLLEAEWIDSNRLVNQTTTASAAAVQQNSTDGSYVEGIGMKRRKLGDQQLNGDARDEGDCSKIDHEVEVTAQQPSPPIKEGSTTPESSDSDTNEKNDCGDNDTPSVNVINVVSSAMPASPQLSNPISGINDHGSPDHDQQNHRDQCHSPHPHHAAKLQIPLHYDLSESSAGYHSLDSRINGLEARLEEQKQEIDFIRSRVQVQGGTMHIDGGKGPETPPPRCPEGNIAPPNTGLLNMNLHTQQKVKRQPPETPTKMAGESFEVIEID
ncbi:hypothetical protein KEM54_006591 [Ascosphaera aggregata]|nr:hypothetical protein KEM54_006591 [Ascosphaera aggregata]